MYRPDRIGPHMLATLESVPNVVSGIPTVASSGVVRAETSDGIPRDNHRAQTWFFDADQDLPVGEGGAFGVKVSGAQLFERGEYLLSFGGSFMGHSSDEAVAVRPIIGRFNTPGVQGSTMNQWALVPGDNSVIATSGAAIAPVEVTCNGTIVIGDFEPTGVLLENDLFFGFWMSNGGAGAAAISGIHASMSIHRYTEDLHPFDPNR